MQGLKLKCANTQGLKSCGFYGLLLSIGKESAVLLCLVLLIIMISGQTDIKK